MFCQQLSCPEFAYFNHPDPFMDVWHSGVATVAAVNVGLVLERTPPKNTDKDAHCIVCSCQIDKLQVGFYLCWCTIMPSIQLELLA